MKLHPSRITNQTFFFIIFISLVFSTTLTTAQEKQIVRVRTLAAKISDSTRTISLTGQVQAQVQTSIAFQISGRIVQRFVEIDDRVDANTVLARIESPTQRLAFISAQAVLTGAQAELTEANTDLERQTRLYASGTISRSAFETAEQRAASVGASLSSAVAALSLAREQLGYAELRAPTSGTIIEHDAEVGQVVQPGQTVFLLAENGARDVVLDVFETAHTDFSADIPIYLSLVTEPSIKATGYLREISPIVNAVTGTIRVKVGIIDPPAEMILGAAISASAILTSPSRIELPERAISLWQGQPAVWVVDPTGSTVNPFIVSVERYTTTSIILTDGIKSGDIVVVAGNQFLRPGQRVDAVMEVTE